LTQEKEVLLGTVQIKRQQEWKLDLRHIRTLKNTNTYNRKTTRKKEVEQERLTFEE
jgi:hypothetical protein